MPASDAAPSAAAALTLSSGSWMKGLAPFMRTQACTDGNGGANEPRSFGRSNYPSRRGLHLSEAAKDLKVSLTITTLNHPLLLRAATIWELTILQSLRSSRAQGKVGLSESAIARTIYGGVSGASFSC